MNSLQTDIEARLAETAPDVEVLLAEVLGGHTVRLFIDHPEGVSVALCERVTHLLPEVRERYALEVSSPGGTRPLTKPAHFRRFLGRRARVRLRDASIVDIYWGFGFAQIALVTAALAGGAPWRRHARAHALLPRAGAERRAAAAPHALRIPKRAP